MCPVWQAKGWECIHEYEYPAGHAQAGLRGLRSQMWIPGFYAFVFQCSEGHHPNKRIGL